MRERERKDISIEKFSKSRCEEKKRVGSAVQGNFCRVGRVRQTTEFFFCGLRAFEYGRFLMLLFKLKCLQYYNFDLIEWVSFLD